MGGYKTILSEIFIKNTLQSAVKFGIISLQSQKTIAEPQNSTYLQLAQSTPKACFFMRNIRTPKEFADFVFIHQIYKSLSMVACSGKGSPFAVFQLSQFLRPLHVTAKASELYAVTLKCLQLELRKMYQFIFALIRAPQIKIRLLADNEQQARSRFTDGDTLLFVGRINQNPLKNNRTFSTNGNNHSLPAGQNVGSIESTTTIEGNRNPYQCGIFLPKIHSLHVPEKSGALSYIEFAVQMISRNKAEFIRTNKASRSIAVVESVSHPFTGDTLTLTKSIGNPTMKIYPKNNRTFSTNGKNHSLPAGQNVGSIESTTTQNGGNRSRYQCGFFIPQIPFSYVPENLGALSQAEFVARSIRRNKAEFIRTNKASNHPFSVVVEPLSHLTTGYGNLFTNKLNGNPTMKIYPKNNRTLAALPTLSVSAAQGGANV